MSHPCLGKLKNVFFCLLLTLAISKTSSAETSPSIELAVHSPENLAVQSYSVEIGKSLALPARNPSRYLVSSPEVIRITQMRPDAIDLIGQKLGSTLILVWEETEIRSIQITVTREMKEIEKIQQIKQGSSKLYQSRKSRSFKTTYESGYSILEQGKILNRVSEVRKIYNHAVSFKGNTPLGDLAGSFFYEYRKEQSMGKSVALPRNAWIGFFDTDLPGKILDHYDMIGGEQYLSLSEFGFPGARYSGFTLLSTKKRAEKPKKGRLDLSFFVGREERGAFLDNPANTNQRNIKLNNRLTGERVDYHLWERGKISLGTYQKWGGPTASNQAEKNYDTGFDFGFPYVRFKGQTGLDNRRHTAMRYRALFENSWTHAENIFLYVDPNYRTITGTTLDQGRRGWQLHSRFLPLMPWIKSDTVELKFDADITRDLLSVNPKHPHDYNKYFKAGAGTRLPFKLKNEVSFEYRNRLATSFPYTRKRIHERLSREISFNSRWIKRMRLYGLSTLERYGDAENTPGFNAIRHEVGGGNYVYLLGGIWLSGQYLWDRLDEKEANLHPDKRTKPGQLTLAGGVNHSFRRLPISVGTSFRYTDERKTIPKLHDPFINEDRFEVRGSVNVRLPDNSTFYVETRATRIESLVGNPKRMELALALGTRLNFDTHFYFPQKATIEGYFFLDKNANGLKDAQEEGLPGMEVGVEKGPKTKSGHLGFYRLRLWEGLIVFKATDKIPEGYFFTTPSGHELEMLPQMKTRIDFGIIPQTQVKGRAYVDINGNFIFDQDDAPVSALQVVLDSEEFAVTSSQGLYSILQIKPGANRIRLYIPSIPTGYRTITPIEKKFEGKPGEFMVFDIVMTVERYVGGSVFLDTNKDGRRALDEPGIANVSLSIDAQEATTDKSGKYSFKDLKPGLKKIKLEKSSLNSNYTPSLHTLEIEIPAGFIAQTDLNFPVQEKEVPAPALEEPQIDPSGTN